ncbi:MAG: hypothetical protein V1776_01255 [Candidatus Diapherotrites archaeon]
MVNGYRKDMIAEGKIARDLHDKGFQNIHQRTGSLGTADSYALKDGQKYYVQVKNGAARVDPDVISHPQKLAQDRSGSGVVINRQDGQNKWRFFGNWGCG